MMVAGEASGDKHGAALAQALTRLYPETDFEIFGAGGEEMRRAGVETLVDARDVGIIGVLEVAGALGRLYRAYRRLLAAARKRRPVAVILIDWPDFNLRLAKRLRPKGTRIIYYISPQVWAWKQYRVRAIRRDVNRMLVILPFEKEFYERVGIEVEYVGHPLVSAVRSSVGRDEFTSAHRLDPTRPIFALLPGSRKKEVHYHLPAMLDAARLLLDDPSSEISTFKSQTSNLKSQISDFQFLIPLASTIDRDQIETVIKERCQGDALDVRIIEGDLYNTLHHADMAVVASGTATVETALALTPMVIIYRGSELSWRLLRPLIHLDTFGMVNLIAGQKIVPELMQKDVTGERIAREVKMILSNPTRLSQMRQDLKRVRRLLEREGEPGPDRAARAVMHEIDGLIL